MKISSVQIYGLRRVKFRELPIFPVIPRGKQVGERLEEQVAPCLRERHGALPAQLFRTSPPREHGVVFRPDQKIPGIVVFPAHMDTIVSISNGGKPPYPPRCGRNKSAPPLRFARPALAWRLNNVSWRLQPRH